MKWCLTSLLAIGFSTRINDKLLDEADADNGFVVVVVVVVGRSQRRDVGNDDDNRFYDDGKITVLPVAAIPATATAADCDENRRLLIS